MNTTGVRNMSTMQSVAGSRLQEVLVKALPSFQSFRVSSQNEVLASLAFQNICELGSSLAAPRFELKQSMEPFHFLFLMTLGYKGKRKRRLNNWKSWGYI